jgi:hypothetical protein
VFPLAIYFAEAVGATIFALPHSQFCLQKSDERCFSFTDLTGEYDNTSLRNQVAPEKLFKIALQERFPGTMAALRKTKKTILQLEHSAMAARRRLLGVTIFSMRIRLEFPSCQRY